MADVVPNKTDDNSQAAASASSTGEAQDEVSNTPPVENTGETNKSENKVPQSRFSEVVHERNSEREARERLEQRIRELESARSEGVSQKQSVYDREAKRLAEKLNMEESAAKEIVSTFQNLNQVQRLEQEAAQNRFQAENWATQKAENDPVYREIEPELDKSFSSLKPEMQSFIARNPEALEMFYESIKSKHTGSKSKELYEKGADDAYKNKAAKQAVTSVPGGSSSGGKTALTRKGIAEMIKNDISQYVKRQSEINEAILNGTLK